LSDNTHSQNIGLCVTENKGFGCEDMHWAFANQDQIRACVL